MDNTPKHRKNTSTFVNHIPTEADHDIYIVDTPNGYEYMICDPSGRTLVFSDNHYQTQREAMNTAVADYNDRLQHALDQANTHD